jgi:hypothetical protein
VNRADSKSNHPSTQIAGADMRPGGVPRHRPAGFTKPAGVPRLAGRVLRAGALIILCPGVVAAETVVLNPTKDVTIFFNLADESISVGGLFAGRNRTGSNRRGLIAFDLSAIPAGAVIDSVSLSMTVAMSQPGNFNIALRKVLADWGEGTNGAAENGGQPTPASAGSATWLYRFFNTLQWTAEGGDFSGTLSATASAGVSPSTTTWSGAGMVADVQGWVDQPATNFGWILIGDEATAQSVKEFYSGETGGPLAPRLTVTFTADSDEDGINDDEDNCPAVANPLQEDFNDDGVGDACDEDDDGDGVPDIEDAFPQDPTESVDTDGDGTGNNADEDDDGDGLPDAYEIANELDPLNAADAGEDPDGDGFSNLEEFQAGTDPRDAASHPPRSILPVLQLLLDD